MRVGADRSAPEDISMDRTIKILSVAGCVLLFGASFAGTLYREWLATAAYVITIVLGVAVLGVAIAQRR